MRVSERRIQWSRSGWSDPGCGWESGRWRQAPMDALTRFRYNLLWDKRNLVSGKLYHIFISAEKTEYRGRQCYKCPTNQYRNWITICLFLFVVLLSSGPSDDKQMKRSILNIYTRELWREESTNFQRRIKCWGNLPKWKQLHGIVI